MVRIELQFASSGFCNGSANMSNIINSIINSAETAAAAIYISYPLISHIIRKPIILLLFWQKANISYFMKVCEAKLKPCVSKIFKLGFI